MTVGPPYVSHLLLAVAVSGMSSLLQSSSWKPSNTIPGKEEIPHSYLIEWREQFRRVYGYYFILMSRLIKVRVGKNCGYLKAIAKTPGNLIEGPETFDQMSLFLKNCKKATMTLSK